MPMKGLASVCVCVCVCVCVLMYTHMCAYMRALYFHQRSLWGAIARIVVFLGVSDGGLRDSSLRKSLSAIHMCTYRFARDVNDGALYGTANSVRGCFAYSTYCVGSEQTETVRSMPAVLHIVSWGRCIPLGQAGVDPVAR